VVEVCGASRREQLSTFVRAVVRTVDQHGEVGMPPAEAAALAGLRAFNYERIYVRPESVAQSRAVIEVLRALVEHYLARPDQLPEGRDLDRGSEATVRAAVTYVAGMTDRYAFDRAVELLGWEPDRLPPTATSA
jgi:dGTPase